MEGTSKRENGILKISDEVIEKIAETVVSEVEGVDSLAPAPAKLKNLVIKSQGNKGIAINFDSGVCIIDVYVVLKMGYKIKTVAEKVQQSIKETVQNMCGIAVSKVNVYIKDIKVTD